MRKKSMQDIDVCGEKVLVRVDFNVPQDDRGNITDDTKIRATIPTIKNLIERGAAVILASHLGRPQGKIISTFSLKPIGEYLSGLLKKTVHFSTDCIGDVAENASSQLQIGEILLLENLRFHVEEEQNDLFFAEALAKLADIVVNDAFGVSHRAHASVEGISRYLPVVAGLLMEKEINFLGKALEVPKRPFAAIIGGAKVSDKISVIEKLLHRIDILIIGGGMAHTFLAAQGYQMGSSLVDSDKFVLALDLLKKAKEKEVKFLLPMDFIVADRFAPNAKVKVVSAKEIPANWMALDIGPDSVTNFRNALKESKTVVWNGPMGVFEIPIFSRGTMLIAQAVANLKDVITIVGGGDSIAAIEKSGEASKITHISTGGGASLEFLKDKVLPGLAVLAEK